MNENNVIVIEKLHKKYRLGVISVDTLANDLSNIWKSFKSKLFISLNKNKSNKNIQDKEYIWALKNINLKIKNGEIVGLIGSNGAGKSTLLKILSKITTPSIGSIKIKGRIASLLEVGTGFHNELTGKENIFLNGAILGMTKLEIKQKLNAIIEFSGMEEFINTPVKRYSSGMKVRLAFSVAAHLEPEILLIDEVLAVGDADFQKKCLGKMNDISESGRTIIFVSHNMTAIKSLCNRSIVLDKGEIIYDGNSNDAVKFYLKGFENKIKNDYKWDLEDAVGGKSLKITSIKIEPLNGDSLDVGSGITFLFECYTTLKKLPIHFGFQIYTQDGALVIHRYYPLNDTKKIDAGFYLTKVDFPADILNKGIYNIILWYGLSNTTLANTEEKVISFEILPGKKSGSVEEQKGLLDLNLNYKSYFSLNKK
jgi:lipopolysaccharide transport system ATP-binding protein